MANVKTPGLEQHIFQSSTFNELLEEAIHFFENTPIVCLPPKEKFSGAGVYALYYQGDCAAYGKIALKLQNLPIYVGKAVLSGWRQGRIHVNANDTALYRRLKEHSRSMIAAKNLCIEDFSCRFVVVPVDQTDLIGSFEAVLIRKYQPLWNSYIDGFGNHDPGKGRYQQAKSEWDVLHSGRAWAKKLTGDEPKLEAILEKINKYANT